MTPGVSLLKRSFVCHLAAGSQDATWTLLPYSSSLQTSTIVAEQPALCFSKKQAQTHYFLVGTAKGATNLLAIAASQRATSANRIRTNPSCELVINDITVKCHSHVNISSQSLHLPAIATMSGWSPAVSDKEPFQSMRTVPSFLDGTGKRATHVLTLVVSQQQSADKSNDGRMVIGCVKQEGMTLYTDATLLSGGQWSRVQQLSWPKLSANTCNNDRTIGSYFGQESHQDINLRSGRHSQ